MSLREEGQSGLCASPARVPASGAESSGSGLGLGRGVVGIWVTLPTGLFGEHLSDISQLQSQPGGAVSQHSRRLLPPAKTDSSGSGIYLQLRHFRAAP